MSLSPAAQNSIEIVFPEIVSTLHQAELSLTRFQENRDSGEDLQNCIDCLNQLRGIFTVVEVQGCVMLCQESVSLANDVPVGANDDKNGLLASLSNAIFILRRYSEYFHHQKSDHPQLLIPIINELRKAGKAKPLPESHFVDINPQIHFDFASKLGIQSGAKSSNFELHAKRLRHMYQVGLLDLLKNKNVPISLRLVSRATEGGAKLLAGSPLAQFMSLVSIVSRVMAGNEAMELTASRKLIFMNIEKYLREMVRAGDSIGETSPSTALVKDLLYLLALANDKSELSGDILIAYDLDQIDYNEEILQQESRRLFGPGADVLRSLSKAIQEELIQLKDKLDIFERGGVPNDEDMSFVVTSLERLSGTTKMLDLPNISALCHRQVDVLNRWKDGNIEVSEDELLSVADAILTIELVTSRFEETGIQVDIDERQLEDGASENSYLSTANVVVVEESCTSLVLAKRSISSYIESQGDKLHLVNVAPVLDSVRGAMNLFGQDKVGELLSYCAQCVTTELYEAESMPDDLVLETLADALASIEYYIESLNLKEPPNAELLNLAAESLKTIGYGA